ncbi:pyridoxal phosphate-dependent aminotransferase [Aestuariibius sp. 2305UL40-4]|uniref:pyridoxal phosphate-dependent aminotransferase n=1 Tax=Aestuariibius violaceus TaxID=3234132 RepID=UPI00345E3D4D
MTEEALVQPTKGMGADANTYAKLRLNLNESPFPPLPSVVREIAQELDGLNRYPPFHPRMAQDCLAEWLHLDASNVITGSGSVGVALQVLETIRPSRVVYCSPTFEGYPILADMVAAEKYPVPLDSVGMQDLNALADCAGLKDTVVVICNPHNPTGTFLPPSEILSFLEHLPECVSVLIDEAYIEFSDKALRCDVNDLLSRHERVVVLRTFSKAYGLAGMRIGYGIANPSFGDRIQARALPFGFSMIAQTAMKASISNEAELEARIENLRAERQALQKDLRKLGRRVLESQTNFLWLPWSDGGADWVEPLESHGVLAKVYPDQGVRLSIGSKLENNIVRLTGEN